MGLLKRPEGDDQKVEMDEENRRLKEQMKWKMEQFKHLEEAHQKLKDEFLSSKEDWDVERSSLADEVFELKTRVESQTRMSNELQSRLELCDQALVRQESKIKTLEAELTESKVFYEKALNECRESKAELENLLVSRDDETGNLRSSLVEKEAMCKEYECMSRKIEQENQELLAMVKELQEAQIQGASSSASSSSVLTRMKSRLRNMEQKHKDKEAERNLKLQKLAGELKMKELVITELSLKLEDLEKAPMNFSSNLEISDDGKSSQLERMNAEPSQDGVIADLKMELEECHCTIMQLKVENEETSLKLSAYENGFAKMESDKAEMEKLHDALLDELERHKGMVIEMSENERYLKEQCLGMECELKERMQEVENALTKADTELTAASCELSETELELQEWKAMAERLEIRLLESNLMRKQVEHSLLQEVEIAEKLKQEKMELYEDLMKLSTERERLVEHVKELCDRRLSKTTSNEEDLLQLMGRVGNLKRNFDDMEPKKELAGKEDKFSILKENLNINISPTIHKFEILSNSRTPFTEITHPGAPSS